MKKLTKKFIKENAEMTLKEVFPEVFEVEFKIGIWYKSKTHPKMLVFPITEDENGHLFGFGFDNYGTYQKIDNDSQSNCMCNSSAKYYLIPATPQEIQEALEKEAVSRGYRDGIIIKPLWETPLYSWNVYENQIRFEEKSNAFYFGCCIFKGGIWAQTIPTITKQEAEERLGMKII